MKGGSRLPNLVRNRYSPYVDEIKIESGDKSSPIWLIINPNYPTVRQEVWIPILEIIQDRVYRKLHNRIGTEHIYIKSTVSDLGRVPSSNREEISEGNKILMESILRFQPKILITFGSLTYELINRLIDQRSEKGYQYWGSADLELEFERSILNFDVDQINKIPLPRHLKKVGRNIEDHNYFVGENSEDYIQKAGTKIADRIIENKDYLNIWI